MCMCTCVCTFVHECAYMYICTFMCVKVYVCMCTFVCECVYECTRVHIYVTFHDKTKHNALTTDFELRPPLPTTTFELLLLQI